MNGCGLGGAKNSTLIGEMQTIALEQCTLQDQLRSSGEWRHPGDPGAPLRDHRAKPAAWVTNLSFCMIFEFLHDEA